MWDDEINKKIKDAADQYHPAYDENAWDKMELLLDQHLPVEKKRKRKYFLILLTSLLLGGSLLVIYYNQNKTLVKSSQKTETTNNITATQSLTNKPDVNERDASSSNITAKASNTIKPISQLNQESINQHAKNSINKTSGDKPGKALINTTRATSFNKHGKTNATIIPAAVGEDTGTKNRVEENSKNGDPGYVSNEHAFFETETNILNNSNLRKKIPEIKDIDKGEVKLIGKIVDPVVPNKSKRFKNNFAITFSAGPDISSVGLDRAGTAALNFGAGISYALSHRLTLRTGFYKAEKIYSASKDQYHVPSGGNIAYLYNIDANCKVYEIPVTVSYNFGKVKNHQWFASAGLSSYLMKKESYDYYYKYPNGNAYTKSWSISNQNKHYFSVLDISAGYEYSFSKRASLIAEPYLKIPLSGIGAGKVNLNSAGMLFTFAFRPF